MLLDRVTLCVPFYRQSQMLAKQLETWTSYDDETLERFKFIVVDDGSPEPAMNVIGEHGAGWMLDDTERFQLYRIEKDIPWNRSGARNLASHVCDTDWLVHVDTDHVLPPESAKALLTTEVDPSHWYRFPRWRVGKADETRRKDSIPDDCELGRIHEHIDSYLCTRDLYWSAGGYNESFSGILGGGSPFLAELAKVGGEPKLLPVEIHLHVYTRSVIPDASVFTLDRDTSEYKRRKRELLNAGKLRGHDPLRFPWVQVL
jgi:glycosyl transferase family 2